MGTFPTNKIVVPKAGKYLSPRVTTHYAIMRFLGKMCAEWFGFGYPFPITEANVSICVN